MNSMWRSVSVAASAVWVLAGCASSRRIEMNVVAFSDPEYPLASVRKFVTVETGMSENPLLEKELLAIVRDSLIAHGMQYSPDSAEVVVVLNGYIGPYREYVPPKTIHLPRLEKSTTKVKGRVGTTDVSGTAKTKKWTTTPVEVGGGYQTTFYRQLYVAMATIPPPGDSSAVVWMGEAESFGSAGDLRIVAPYFVRELLTEFPEKSGLPSYRKARMIPMRKPPAKQ